MERGVGDLSGLHTTNSCRPQALTPQLQPTWRGPHLEQRGCGGSRHPDCWMWGYTEGRVLMRVSRVQRSEIRLARSWGGGVESQPGQGLTAQGRYLWLRSSWKEKCNRPGRLKRRTVTPSSVRSSKSGDNDLSRVGRLKRDERRENELSQYPFLRFGRHCYLAGLPSVVSLGLDSEEMASPSRQPPLGGSGLLHGSRARSYGSLVQSSCSPVRERRLEHQLEPGDTLAGLALKYGVTVSLPVLR